MAQQQKNSNARRLIVWESSGRQRLRILVLSILACLLLIGAGVAYYVYDQLQPATGLSAPVKVDIPPGSSVREIGQLLESAGLIKHGGLFAYYVSYKGKSTQLKAGEYLFPPGQPLDALIDQMVRGDVVKNTVRFTIPEGWNVEQIAAHLAEKGLVDKQAFLREVNEGEFPQFSFVSSIPRKEGRKYRLEGYLFPETYEVDADATEHDIIARMLAQFEQEMKPEWLETLKARGLSLDEAVTLASIVEREVTVDKERPMVAGVYYNRLREKWLLQADATVQFVLGKQRDRLTYEDLKVESPYNTYLHPGLPPGPIANPGRASLEAVIHPARHDYFFYVTKKDGSNEHYFSKTLSEHLSQDAKSRKNETAAP